MSKSTRAKQGAPLEFLRNMPETDECVVWPFAHGRYGYVRFNGPNVTAHRVSLIIATGKPPPPGMDAAHEPVVCNNRLCVNPRHLRWATRSENCRDRELDGTQAHMRGELSGMSKLTTADVLAIRADTRPQETIAAQYGVTQTNISLIKSRKSWRHV